MANYPRHNALVVNIEGTNDWFDISAQFLLAKISPLSLARNAFLFIERNRIMYFVLFTANLNSGWF